ncbi:MAG: hypothetical protein NZN28_04535 [Meiothermus sp.]|uniref:hypothetical protein n=1 Tax=Meiothermus sp. TaxID=1955249 RepID=UPI0025F46C90|nr:hypothetical protein [Meiothermus sp.]MCS7067886.1 hypothetical protein [Meiothermus sp.]
MVPRYPTQYGLHTSIDLICPSGGDNDLGQPLHALTDGQVEAVLKNAGPSRGNLAVIGHPGLGVWSR